MVIHQADRWIRAGIVGLALLFPVLFLVLAAIRLTYPFELEWMEGAMTDHVWRVVHGQPLYVQPSLEFTPFIYPPGFYWSCALLSRVVGFGFVAGRVVSILATLGTLVLIHRIVRLHTGLRLAGLVGAGIYAATYAHTDAWMDLGRVDSLFVFLVLAGFAAMQRRSGMREQLLAALLFTLAFLCKQSTLLVVTPLLLHHLFVERGRSRFVLPGAFALLTGIAVVGLDVTSGGWFRYYAFGLPARHAWALEMLRDFWTKDLLATLAPALALSFLGLRASWVLGELRAVAWLACLGLGCVGSAWFSRMHVGGHENVLMTADLFLAIGLGCGLRGVLDESRPGLRKLTLLGLVALQFVLLAYDPRYRVPTPEQLTANHELAARIQESPGPVLIPAHGALALQAGWPMTAHQMALFDVVRSADDEVARELKDDILRRLRSLDYSTILLDHGWEFEGVVEQFYGPPAPILESTLDLVPVSGVRTRPTRLFRRD
jgi:4-amino-4-deoxy-L-arabinose transferase-like glycosyltransferase